jgi:hypothetical protein
VSTNPSPRFVTQRIGEDDEAFMARFNATGHFTYDPTPPPAPPNTSDVETPPYGPASPASSSLETTLEAMEPEERLFELLKGSITLLSDAQKRELLKAIQDVINS